MEIKVIFNRIIDNKIYMFKNCESLIICDHVIIKTKKQPKPNDYDYINSNIEKTISLTSFSKKY